MQYNQDEEESEVEPVEGELRVVNLKRGGMYVVEIEQLIDGEWVSFEDIASND